MADWTREVSGVVNAFGSGIEGMVNHTKTLQQTWVSTLGSMESALFGSVEKMTTKWIAGELTKLTATKATSATTLSTQSAGAAQSVIVNAEANIKKITSDAAAAAAAAYKAMAGIFPAPVWGVAAGGAAYAGVMAFEGMASASGGYDIPSGVNPLTQLHQQEMVLPATLANPMRSMLSNYASSGTDAGGGGESGGDTHHHHYQISAMDGPSFETFLHGHRDHLQTVLGGMVRSGRAPSMGIATT